MRASLLVAVLILAISAAVAQADEARGDFPPLQLTGTNGQVFEVKDFLGSVTVINFWAFWCGPCRAELPELQKVYNDFAGKGFTVIAVAVDTPPEMVKPFMDRLAVALPVAFIDQQSYAALGIQALPCSVLLDGKGKVVQVYSGYAPSVINDLRQQVGRLLKESKRKKEK